MKFDLVFSNPPYNGNVDIKILNEIVDIADEFVVVHPSTWLIDLKEKTKLYSDFKNKLNNRLNSVEFFNGNNVFNIGLYVPCIITHIKSSDKIDVNFFDDIYEAKNIDDITKFGLNWTDLVKPFYDKISKYIQSNDGSVWANKIDLSATSNTKFHCQIAGIRGNVNLSSKSSQMVKDDFYTMLMVDSDKNKGIRKSDSGGATLEFKTEKELDNFINYLKTDFARFCLAILKNKSDLHRGELELIPWLDFTEEWDDEKLFNKFDVSQELQDYMRDFLPDFHGIRK